MSGRQGGRTVAVVEVDREIERLYGLPLDEFTEARNSLARDLKQAGRDDASARVKRLKKPPISAWAVNRLAREEPDAIRRLLDLLDRLKGARSADEIHALGSERRDAVAKLTRRAGRILGEAGHALSAGAGQRIGQTLQAGAEDDERAALVAGTLSQDLAPAGFDALGTSGGAADTSPPSPRPSVRVEELRRLAAEAEEEAARLGEEAGRAEAAALEASAAASEARRRARAARDEAQRAARSAR